MRRSRFFPHTHPQHGAALLVMLVVLVVGSAGLLVSSLSGSGLKTGRDKITANALAQAKEALIGYAVKIDLSNSSDQNQARPGDLPCPDRDNDGDAEGNCGSAAGSNQVARLGRLPWKTLGLPDLRDGSGERLWYAVSNNFKNNFRTAELNSDTPGSITVRDTYGNILHDGSAGAGIAAVIIAPGAVLRRTDQAAAQDRSAAGENTASNYLDIANNEDNAAFNDSTTDGFIQGLIQDGNSLVILNDQLLAITQDNIMQPAQKRVAAEVKKCLVEFAATSNQRYPWAVPLVDLPDYKDDNDQLFGRIPDDLDKTKGGVMSDKWGAKCNTHFNNTASTWWIQWRELVFYAVAKGYEPDNSNPANPCAISGQCLSVNPPSAAENKKFVAIVAGKKLPGQDRSSAALKEDAAHYLEGLNKTSGTAGPSGTAFQHQPPSATFNDTVVFEQ